MSPMIVGEHDAESSTMVISNMMSKMISLAVLFVACAGYTRSIKQEFFPHEHYSGDTCIYV